MNRKESDRAARGLSLRGSQSFGGLEGTRTFTEGPRGGFGSSLADSFSFHRCMSGESIEVTPDWLGNSNILCFPPVKGATKGGKLAEPACLSGFEGMDGGCLFRKSLSSRGAPTWKPTHRGILR